jgi:ERF superfamily
MTQTTHAEPGWVCVGDITAIAPAWVAALGELEDITRSRRADVTSERTGTSYSYRYAELADATSTARAVLASHDLAVFQVPTIEDGEIAVRTTVMHTSGAHLVFEPFRLPAGSSAQQAGSAATYARRYALMAQLGLATEDDDGAGAATRPPPPPAFLSAGNVARFLTACAEAHLAGDEIGDVVEEATGGRTREPAEAWVTEVAALREALAARRESTTGVSQDDEQVGEEASGG